MTTLAGFKRALTLGSKWKAIHMQSGTELGTREVAKVKTNCIGFMTDRGTISYFDFPKASEYEFKEGKAHIYCNWNGERKLILTYEAV